MPRCPICGVATSWSPVIIESSQAYLPDRSSSSSRVYGTAWVPAVTVEDDHQVSHSILQCQECGERFVAKKRRYDDNDWVPVYPIPHRPLAKELPEPISNLFSEAGLCFAVGAYVGCLLTCRTTLIALQRDKGVSSLMELSGQGLVSPFLYKQADEVRLWANMVGHEDIPTVVAKDDCQELLTYMESLLNAVYVEPSRLSKMAQKRHAMRNSPKRKSAQSGDT